MATPDWLRAMMEGLQGITNPSSIAVSYAAQKAREQRTQQSKQIRRLQKPALRHIPKGGPKIGYLQKQPDENSAVMDFLNMLGSGGGGMSSADIDAILGSEFGPQDRAIDDRLAFGNKAIESMYAALGNDIRENEGRLGGIYDQGISGANSIAADSTGRITASYDAKAAEEANLLQTLGITEATPAVAKEMNTNETAAVGNIEQNRNANTQAINAGKTAGLAYNNSRADLAGMEGKAAQAQLYLAAMAHKAELDSSRASRRSELMSQAGSESPDPMDLFQIYKWQTERQDQQSAAANKGMNPYDATYNLAVQRLGGPEQANIAMDYIRQAMMNMDEVGNAGDFSRLVGSYNRDRRIPYQVLTSLANELYSRLDPREGRNVVSDLSLQRYGMM